MRLRRQRFALRLRRGLVYLPPSWLPWVPLLMSQKTPSLERRTCCVFIIVTRLQCVGEQQNVRRFGEGGEGGRGRGGACCGRGGGGGA
jgi:hypothetical protein